MPGCHLTLSRRLSSIEETVTLIHYFPMGWAEMPPSACRAGSSAAITLRNGCALKGLRVITRKVAIPLEYTRADQRASLSWPCRAADREKQRERERQRDRFNVRSSSKNGIFLSFKYFSCNQPRLRPILLERNKVSTWAKGVTLRRPPRVACTRRGNIGSENAVLFQPCSDYGDPAIEIDEQRWGGQAAQSAFLEYGKNVPEFLSPRRIHRWLTYLPDI